MMPISSSNLADIATNGYFVAGSEQATLATLTAYETLLFFALLVTVLVDNHFSSKLINKDPTIGS
jgi:hypothetical protein